MAAETKTSLTLSTTDQDNKILLEIFQNLNADRRNIMASLRFALYGQDESAYIFVKKYINETLVPEIINEIEQERNIVLSRGFKKSVIESFTKIISDQRFAGDQFKNFFKDLVGKFAIQGELGFVRKYSSDKKESIRQLIEEIIPSFFEGKRLIKYNALWKEIEEERLKSPLRNSINYFRGLLQLAIFMFIVRELTPEQYGWHPAIGVAVFFAVFRITSHVWRKKDADKEISEYEDLLSQIVPRKVPGKTQKYEFEMADLPLASIIHRFAGGSTSSSSTVELKKVFDNKRAWTNVNLSAHSTAAAPLLAAHPIVDLSRELGYSAHYAGRDDDEKNTLFRFQASAETDVRYVFIPPELKDQPEKVQWDKFIRAARYARLASDDNEQGIKALKGKPKPQIKDPETGKGYDAFELKILGGEGSGGIRLLGTMIRIVESDGTKRNVYVFNTVWDKGNMPEHFSSPLRSPLDIAPVASGSSFPSSSLSSSSSNSRAGSVESRDRFVGGLRPAGCSSSSDGASIGISHAL